MDCEHIYGYDESPEADFYDYGTAMLVTDPKWKMTETFTYCPLCGIRLIEEVSK